MGCLVDKILFFSTLPHSPFSLYIVYRSLLAELFDGMSGRLLLFPLYFLPFFPHPKKNTHQMVWKEEVDEWYEKLSGRQVKKKTNHKSKKPHHAKQKT